jgi:hypothetical protein
MTSLAFWSLVFALCLGTSLGYFLAGVVHWRSYRDSLADLQAERDDIDAEREALHIAWLSASPPPGAKVTFALGAHKKAPGVSA